jgi:hypothetical protein
LTAEETEHTRELERRIESLEARLADLMTRGAALETAEGTAGQPEFHMPDEEQTV